MDYTERKRQRMQERIPCNIDIVINDSVACKAFDISEGGIYVLTDKCFDTGSTVKLSLLFKDEKLEIQSKVKYCHEGIGMGLMFIDLDDVVKAKIKELFENIKQTIEK
jgi:Tfp pilus assembly protein PilZ